MGPANGGGLYKGATNMIIFYAALLLGILIFVHELGHFLLAKLLGVKVLKFSLGFGPRLVGMTFGETEYRLSLIPLGGYVKMLGEEPGEVLENAEKARAYNQQPVWKRFSIVFSGPLFNLIFAAFVTVLIFLSGVPVPHPDIGKIEDASPAAAAGLRTGDRVVEINAHPVESWMDIDAFMNENPGEKLLFRIDREGEILELSVIPRKKMAKTIFGEEKEIWDIGMMQLLYPEVGEVIKGSPAEKAGLIEKDRITEIGGKRLKTWQEMTEIIHENPETALDFKILRNDREVALTITPEKKMFATPDGEEKEIGLIGIRPAGNDFTKRYGLDDAISLGIRRTWNISVLTVVSIAKLIQRVIPADTIGGPILIFQMAGQQASKGALDFFGFMAIISINLGILNLLPIPILDGGHLLFLAVEAIRRKPLSENVTILAQKIGLVVILTLIAFAFYNDIVRLVTGKTIP